MYRIIFRDGMRYDFGFEFEFEDHLKLDLGEQPDAGEQNDNWPADNINRFWFIQIQALGKLYRKDYLISCHLANMNCNETLVIQMVLRDLKYGTNHHRYGYAEELEYMNDLGKAPYRTGDQIFNHIADCLYAAALTYDRLAKEFYPQYQNRSDVTGLAEQCGNNTGLTKHLYCCTGTMAQLPTYRLTTSPDCFFTRLNRFRTTGNNDGRPFFARLICFRTTDKFGGIPCRICIAILIHIKDRYIK